MSKKKISLVFIFGLIIGIFVVNPILRLIGLPVSDEIITFLFGQTILSWVVTQIRKVEVAAFKEEWTTLYEIEAEKLKRIFGENITAIYHIGSTSVSGLKAKPIIDIMPVVKDIELVDQLNEKMQELSYEPMGEFGIPGRRYFRKGKESVPTISMFSNMEVPTSIGTQLSVIIYVNILMSATDMAHLKKNSQNSFRMIQIHI